MQIRGDPLKTEVQLGGGNGILEPKSHGTPI
jgi:hypothetical protein